MSVSFQIGTVKLLHDRIYEDNVAPAGTYPLMREGGAAYISLTGYPLIPAGTVEPLGDGMFAIGTCDRVKDGRLEYFRSKEWTMEELRQLMAEDPAFLPGPERRLVVALFDGAVAPFNPAAPLSWEGLTPHESFPTTYTTTNGALTWVEVGTVAGERASLLDEDGDPYFTFNWPKNAADLVQLLGWAYEKGLDQGKSAGRERLKYELRQLIGALAAEP